MKNIARKIFEDALKACSPAKLLDRQISFSSENKTIYIQNDQWQLGEKSIYIIAIGKASAAMSITLQRLFSVDAEHIICIAPGLHKNTPDYCIGSSHPLPDAQSVLVAEKLIRFIDKIPSESFILFALSGGASALVCKPAPALGIEDVNSCNKLLLNSGATIKEMNTVRKHLSAIKGGQLLSRFKKDCVLIDLVISDVPNDDLAVIGSGLTIPDSSTFEDAVNVLRRYDLWHKVPGNISNHLQKGINGEVSETLKQGEDQIKNHVSYIVGSAQIFARKAAAIAEKEGYQTWVVEKAFNNSAEKVAEEIFGEIEQRVASTNGNTALFFYGESTVKVTGTGKGGRNQELALYGALKIEGFQNITWLSAGTDGVDGPTDAAGAIVDGETIEKASKDKLKAKDFLRNNDSYHFHERMGTLLKTGPTGNNLMDIVIVIIG